MHFRMKNLLQIRGIVVSQKAPNSETVAQLQLQRARPIEPLILLCPWVRKWSGAECKPTVAKAMVGMTGALVLTSGCCDPCVPCVVLVAAFLLSDFHGVQYSFRR